MNCYQARTLLGAYLDGEIIDLAIVNEIEVHLAEGDRARKTEGLEGSHHGGARKGGLLQSARGLGNHAFGPGPCKGPLRAPRPTI